MDWKVGIPRINRHVGLRLDDLNDVNEALLDVTKRLLELAEGIEDQTLSGKLASEVGELSDVSRRLSLATRSIAKVTVGSLETS